MNTPLEFIFLTSTHSRSSLPHRVSNNLLSLNSYESSLSSISPAFMQGINWEMSTLHTISAKSFCTSIPSLNGCLSTRYLPSYTYIVHLSIYMECLECLISPLLPILALNNDNDY